MSDYNNSSNEFGQVQDIENQKEDKGKSFKVFLQKVRNAFNVSVETIRENASGVAFASIILASSCTYYSLYIYPELNNKNYKKLSMLHRATLNSKIITYENTFKYQGLSKNIINQTLADNTNDLVLSEHSYDIMNNLLIFLADKMMNIGIDSNMDKTEIFINVVSNIDPNINKNNEIARVKYKYLLQILEQKNIYIAQYMLVKIAKAIQELDIKINSLDRSDVYKNIEFSKVQKSLIEKRFNLYAQFYWVSKVFSGQDFDVLKKSMEIKSQNNDGSYGNPFVLFNTGSHKAEQLAQVMFKYNESTSESLKKYFNEVIADAKAAEKNPHDQMLMNKYVKNLEMWSEIKIN